MGELFSEFGDLVFTLVIGYISAIEFLYVVRHLYHYSFNHDANVNNDNDGENLSQLQNSMRQQLANAKDKEALAGTPVMKDGVPYKDGFRLEAQQSLIDQLKEQLKNKELSDLKRQELEKELAKQMKIAEKLRKELAEAEAKYQRHLKQEEEAKAKKLLEEQKQREKEERAKKEAEEQALKLIAAEKQRELEQRKKEEEERIKMENEQKAKEQERQRKEEEQARKMAEAEEQRELEQRKREEEERIKMENEQKAKEQEREREEKQRQLEEAEKNARKLQEAEKQREAEQRKLEEEQERARLEAEENERKLFEAEKQKEHEQRLREQQQEEEARYQQELAEAEENAQRLLALEKAQEEKQAEEEAKNLFAIEHRLEEQLRAAEKETDLTEKEQQLIESIKSRDLTGEQGNEQREADLLRKILQAREQLGEESEEEQSIRLLQRERDQEAKQKRVEENAILFMEAENEMAALQAKMLDAVEKREFNVNLDSAPQTPVIEEPCIKRTLSPLMDRGSPHNTVKTQLAQDLTDPYYISSKSLMFPGVSDDASSIDPASSQQSSFSTQPSEEITTGTDSQYLQQERQEPDGEDTPLINMQYSDDYLRSLDGIKQRPLVREDGSGRRRAFKKRRSSNSSNSSRESRHSRDEELKMFTSLEEEEMKDTADSEFTPLRYTSEPTLKVKGHHRRHKRSPAKDMKHSDDSLRSSLERLGEETSDPWGEVKPEHYKHTEFWKREKNLSIDEEAEFEKPTSSEDVAYDTATNMPSASSFEKATQIQNEEALTALQKHSAQRDATKEKSDDQAAAKEESARSDNTNLQTSPKAEKEASPARSSASPRLRRSPRIEEMDQYEERWKETSNTSDKSGYSTAQNTPTINVQTPLDFAPWRDAHGLMMEGLSDFYDFTAAINPSRSNPASRNVSPANTAPNTPLPKDVLFQIDISNEEVNEKKTVEIYDDTEDLQTNEFKKENIFKFIDSFHGNEATEAMEEEQENQTSLESNDVVKYHLKNVADDPAQSATYQASLVPLVNIIDDVPADALPVLDDNEPKDTTMNDLVSSLRMQQSNRSRSRSKSPLPTPDNLQRSVENRRFKMIKHNEDILEKLIETKLLPELTPPEEIEEKSQKEERKASEKNLVPDNQHCSEELTNSLVQSLQIDHRRSRSKSPMRLPTPENLSRGLEKRRSKLIERNDELIKQLEERSHTPESPTIVVEHVYVVEGSEEANDISSQKKEPRSPSEEDDCSREKMDLLVQSLREARSKTRSKSPMRFKEVDNLNETSESTTFYGFQHSEYMENTQYTDTLTAPTISIEVSESTSKPRTSPNVDDVNDCSKKSMDLLVQSLREARSRSRSKSPMRFPQTQEPSALTLEYVYEFEKTEDTEQRFRHSRSMSPSRSHSLSPGATAALRSNTPSRSLSTQPDDYNEFHVMLNLEGSQNKTLSITSEEKESLHLAERQRQLDEEALERLRNASEEMELRTLSPLVLDKDELGEQQSKDYLSNLPITERAKVLRKSPTTPDYDRTISEEMRDVERIKKERLKKGFKRSTYVGESMDLGSEFEPLRKEAAHFLRSRSPSPSFSLIDSAAAQLQAEGKRKLQEKVLQELTTSNSDTKETKSTGAIPKTERVSSCEIELSLTNETEDTKLIKEELLSSTFQATVETDELEELRRKNAEFRRSTSTSRSPLREAQIEELANIESLVAKKVLKDKMLDKGSYNSKNFQDFSRHLNTDFFDTDRRASDSALINVPEILVQLKDDTEMEPEEYHHFRRFSLAQEEPTEEYPGDDYIFIQQVEVRTRSGSRTWLREDFYSENVEEYLENREEQKKKESSAEKESQSQSAVVEAQSTNDHQQEQENVAAADDDDDYSNPSDDDRQTVVEVDDEIDEDISDFNDRGPAEESHHETSECEEAEREMDRFAGREASDWNRVVDVDDVMISENRAYDLVTSEEDEGAVGGFNNSPYDSDSFAIDQIYDEAVKNRKQSGILREYDSILMQMSVGSEVDEQYLLWSKTKSKNKPKNIEFNTQLLDNERKDSEMRYLGDANGSARQSARLRSRYGYNPVLQTKCLEDDLQVDLNYKPKREYNWRKNFKLDDENIKEDQDIAFADIKFEEEKNENYVSEKQWEELNGNVDLESQMIDVRKFSLGGESVTLFSRSPERNISLVKDSFEDDEELLNECLDKEEVIEEILQKVEKPKKKKTKKKLHKESKDSLEETMNREDEEAYDNQVYSRRSSSIQKEPDATKRKSRSRRSSKSSLTNEDNSGLFSPRSSVNGNEPIADIMEEFSDLSKKTSRPKKLKKRKKVKETMANVAESPIETKDELQYSMVPLNDIPAVSAVITPESSCANILSTLSPQNSVCVTPASIDTDVSLSVEELRENVKDATTTSSSTTASSPSANLSRTSSVVTTPVDTFDILKDANFYPLF